MTIIIVRFQDFSRDDETKWRDKNFIHLSQEEQQQPDPTIIFKTFNTTKHHGQISKIYEHHCGITNTQKLTAKT